MCNIPAVCTLTLETHFFDWRTYKQSEGFCESAVAVSYPFMDTKNEYKIY
jgi:hypothetical protein